MFFHKKENEKVDVKKEKKVYDFENDKGKKLDVSALFDNANSSSSKTKKEAPPTIEFTLDAESNMILQNMDESPETIDTEEQSEENHEEQVKPKFNYKLTFRLFLLSCLITLIATCIWGLNSKVFLIRNIDIKVNQEKILDFLDKADDAKIETYKIARDEIGNNIFLFDRGNLKRKIENISYIYEVNISRSLPYTLEFDVKLRTPYAIIKNEEKYFSIDKYGCIIDEYSEANPKLPQIVGIGNKEYNVGDTLDSVDQVKFKNVAFLLETAETINFEYKISDVDYTESDNVSFYVEEAGIKVIYGEIIKDIMSDKLIYLKAIINQSKDRNLKGTLDISSENYLEKSVLNNEL